MVVAILNEIYPCGPSRPPPPPPLVGLSDHHNLVTSMFRSHVSKLRLMGIQYRSFRNFDENKFLSHLQADIDKIINEPRDVASIFKNYFTNIVEISTGTAPVSIPLADDRHVIEDNLSYYTNHSSNKAIHEKRLGNLLTFQRRRHKCNNR